MDGTETQEEPEREKVWDAIFCEGAMSISELAKNTGLNARRITYLVDHEWFKKLHGLIYIATKKGVRIGAKVAAA